MSKTILTVTIEAVIVGLLLVLIQQIVKKFYKFNITFHKDIEILFITGLLFHLVFEFTGVNLWYAKKYCKLT